MERVLMHFMPKIVLFIQSYGQRLRIVMLVLANVLIFAFALSQFVWIPRGGICKQALGIIFLCDSTHMCLLRLVVGGHLPQ